VTDISCSARRGQLAMDALGCLDDDECTELHAHLAACEECRATSAELRATVGALDTLTKAAPPAPVAVVPPRLTRDVLASLHTDDEVVAHGWKPRNVLLACGSLAAVVIAVVVVSLAMDNPRLPSKTVALQGAHGVTATAVLVEKPWGTSLTIRETGLAAGRTYTVSMDDPQGRWWAAGSYRTSGAAPVEATMACAARFSSIYEIRVTDPGGRTVLSNDPKAAY